MSGKGFNMEGSDERCSIPEFYSGRTIFITGATGFIGKVLVEKLLRSCPDLKRIYVLVRSKKGCDADQRLRNLLQVPIYDLLREKHPSQLNKVVAVNGDVSELGLGLSETDRQKLLEEVSIVFHSAASVRFDDTLKKAVLTNTRGTYQLLQLCQGMQQLTMFVHVSTTYCHKHMPVIGERVYPAPANWRQMIKVCEAMDDNTLNVMEKKVLGELANTYTFAKSLSEHVVVDHSSIIPSVIFRPSVVTNIYNEPLPGWTDNFNGPIGLMVGGGKGLVRIMHSKPDVKVDYIPVDNVVKALIACAWDTVVNRKDLDSDLPVYNSATTMEHCKTQEEIIDTALSFCRELPFKDILWVPNTLNTSSVVYYYVNFILFHILPAVLLDTALVLSKNQPRLMKIQRRLFITNVALSSYILKQWIFDNDKYATMENRIKQEDRQGFSYNSSHGYDTWKEHLKTGMIATKVYMLKEGADRYPQDRKHYMRLYWADRILKVLSIGFLIYLAYNCNVFHATYNLLHRSYVYLFLGV